MLLHFPANTTNPAGYPRTGELPQHVGMRFSLATLSAINQQPAVILFLLVLTNPSRCGGQICDIYFVFYAKIYSEQVDAAPYGQILWFVPESAFTQQEHSKSYSIDPTFQPVSHS